jgi:rubrerythrin
MDMAAASRSNWWAKLFGRADMARATVLEVLRHLYVREKQHAMRYGQHAEKMLYPQFHDGLSKLASEEDKHAQLIAAKIEDLGGELPEVIPIKVAHEPNSWSYLRTDLEEEQRCAGELVGDPAVLGGEFGEVAELLDQIDKDGRRHRAELRDMLARSDPQASDRA